VLLVVEDLYVRDGVALVLEQIQWRVRILATNNQLAVVRHCLNN